MDDITPIQRLEGKASAELLRGSGAWPLQDQPCELEPPLEAYDEHQLTQWDYFCHDEWPTPTIRLPVASWATDHRELVVIRISQFSQDDTTLGQAQQFLQSIRSICRPASFEIRGFGGDGESSPPKTTCHFICHSTDSTTLQQQLQSHYPNSAVEVESLKHHDMAESHMLDQDLAKAIILRLNYWHIHPLATFTNLTIDPLAVALASFESLNTFERAMIQVLFTPVDSPWGQTVLAANRNPYRSGGDYLFGDVTAQLLRDKFTSPLFATSVRLVSASDEVLLQLTGWAEQFANPPQGFGCYDYGPSDPGPPTYPHAIGARCTYWPGFILNAQELAGLVHLPTAAATSEQLQRISARTSPAPKATHQATPGSVLIGHNTHRGTTQSVHIPGNYRPRHCYVAGASGTGKSTLLLNMIKHDIEQGCGIGLLDPHGDLVESVLSIIPKARIKDVVYFNPTDKKHPPAFNILQSYNRNERERTATEFVATIKKFFGSWGDRMDHILVHTLLTITKAKGATLFDARRMLTDDNFRHQIVAQLRDQDLLSFWNHEYPNYPKDVAVPILNKLSPFMVTNTTVRNIICQRQSKFNFDDIINGKKIFLANLSTGLLGKAATGMLGTFIMSRIVNATFRRAAIPEDQRIPFYLYVDEFQNFMDLAVGFEQILAEARKYKLVLAGLANQYIDQLSDEVRQAIFGNVGTLLTFRLGVQDARFVANEFGEFTKEEILALEMGQAIVRIGGTQNSFNLATMPPPKQKKPAIRQAIIEHSRQQYTTPRQVVEQLFQVKPTTSSPTQPPVVKPPSPTTQTKPQPDPEFLRPDDLDDDFVT